MAAAIYESPKLRVASRCRPWLFIILLAPLSGCTADSPATHSPAEQAAAATTPPATAERAETAKTIADDFSLPNPSPNKPVTAAMKIRPAGVSAGAAVELLVYVRIAAVHFVHAADESGNASDGLAIDVTLPDGVEAVGDWQFPTPDSVEAGAAVYRDSILLRRSLKILAAAQPQTVQITGRLHYQVCNDELCWPPEKMALSAPLVIRSSGGNR